MLTKKNVLRAAGASMAAIMSLAAQSGGAQTSEDARIQKLEQAVAALQQRNAALESQISSLKKHPSSEPVATGPTKTEISYDGKTYVEKSVPVEKAAADKWKLSTSISELELYGDVRLRYQYNGGETKDRGP